MELLIDEWGAPVDQHAHDGKTALRCVFIIEFEYLSYYRVDYVGVTCNSMFRVSALEGHYEAVRTLIERGADVDAIDADQRSTLYILALDNRVSMACYLIQKAGADVETRDSEVTIIIFYLFYSVNFHT